MRTYTVYWFDANPGRVLGRSDFTADHFHDALSNLTRLSAPNGSAMLTLVEGPEIISLEPLKSGPMPTTSVITQAETPLIHKEKTP